MSQMNDENARKLLFEMADVLNACRIPHFLMQGTALGAWRDQDFTPTERDIDIGVLAEHFVPSASQLVDTLILGGFELEMITAPFRRVRTIVAKKYGEKADLVSFATWNGQRFASSPVDPVNVPKPYSIVHPADLLERYQLVEFHGRPFYVPSPIEIYLEREYGPDWRTPREDHVSRARRYSFIEQEGIPADLLGE